MFGNQTQFQYKIECSITVLVDFLFTQPLGIEFRQGSEFRHSYRGTSITIYPGIPYFRCNYRQLVLHDNQLFGNLIERASYQTGIRITLMQVGINLLHLFIRMRTVVITGKVDRNNSLSSRKYILRAVILLIDQNQFAAIRISPTAELRYIRYRASRIHTNMQKTNPCTAHRRHNATRMSRHIRHFSGNRLFSVLFIQLMRKKQACFKQIQVHRFRLDSVRNRVPNNIPPSDSFLQAFHFLWRCRMEIFPNQPRPCCPDIFFTCILCP